MRDAHSFLQFTKKMTQDAINFDRRKEVSARAPEFLEFVPAIAGWDDIEMAKLRKELHVVTQLIIFFQKHQDIVRAVCQAVYQRVEFWKPETKDEKNTYASFLEAFSDLLQYGEKDLKHKLRRKCIALRKRIRANLSAETLSVWLEELFSLRYADGGAKRAKAMLTSLEKDFNKLDINAQEQMVFELTERLREKGYAKGAYAILLKWRERAPKKADGDWLDLHLGIRAVDAESYEDAERWFKDCIAKNELRASEKSAAQAYLVLIDRMRNYVSNPKDLECAASLLPDKNSREVSHALDLFDLAKRLALEACDFKLNEEICQIEQDLADMAAKLGKFEE